MQKKGKEMKATAFRYIAVSALIVLLTLVSNVHAGIGTGESTNGVLPVELTSFSASIKDDAVLLSWTTATEVNNYGFEIERSSSRLVGTTPRHDKWNKIGFVQGHGNSNSPKEYSFLDANPLNGNVLYRLKQIDTDGKFEYSQTIELQSNTIIDYVLEQNYPNPFSKGSRGNPTTTISYSIPKAAQVTLKVFDVLGRTIAVLVDQNQDVGSYKVNFDASDLSNGVYLYRLNAGDFTSTKKMLLVQ